MDPFTIALALGLMLGGAYMKKQGLQAIERRQNSLAHTERVRQGRAEEQKQAAISDTMPQLGRQAQEGQQQGIADRLRSYLTPTPVTAGDFVQQQNPGAPKEIMDRKAAAVADAQAKGRDYASKLADVSSYNLLNFGNSRLLNRTGEQVGNIVTGQTNSSNILPFELQGANSAGQDDFLMSDILNGAGSIAGMYALGAPGTKPPAGSFVDAGTPVNMTAGTRLAGGAPRIPFA